MRRIKIVIVLLAILLISIIAGLTYIAVEDKKAEEEARIQEEIIENTNKINFVDNLLIAYPIGQEIDVLKIDYPEIVLTSSDDSVCKIINNKVVTSGKGVATIYASINDVSKSIDIQVTDLYTLPDYDSAKKPFLKETICNEQEAHMLDEVLKAKIDEAGYGTRAGVVAAARFLSLEFPYKLAYFSESGRLDTYNGNRACDGEGRYYHKGLFLSEDKFDGLQTSIYGPAYWGQFFHEDDSDDHSLDDFYLYDGFEPSDIGSHLYLSKRPNGLDCSGYVSWCYLNGGFDLGDMGAGGPGSYGMTDLGEMVYISDELLQSNRIKAGDLVGFVAHIGIVIGVDDNYIWIADTLVTGLKVTRYERNTASFDALGEDAFKYFILMDSEYKQDGNYTEMW